MSASKKCECGCGGEVGPNRTSSKTKRNPFLRQRDGSLAKTARFLPGHNTRLRGGYGRSHGWNGIGRDTA